MSKKIVIQRKNLLEVLDQMRNTGLIPKTYQFKDAEETEFNGRTVIRLNFEEWSYPFVMGKECSLVLPEQLYKYV